LDGTDKQREDNPLPKAVLIPVAVLLLGATVTLPFLARFLPRYDLSALRLRLKAWWTMALLYLIVQRIHPSLSLLGFAALSWVALREYLKRVEELPRSVRISCYAAVGLQYYWVWMGWYGMFIVFIPVYLFLYPPTRLHLTADSIRQTAAVHWGLMATVFCVSHAAFLLTFNTRPAGGAGLLLFVTLLTELGEAIRLLVPKTNPRLLLVLALTIAASLGLSPSLTPMSLEHALLAGLVLGVGGEVGAHRLEQLRIALGLPTGALAPGQGGALVRVLALSYTAPIFLHGFRFFYQ
jgi:phosphatidate cytidylyltransferase